MKTFKQFLREEITATPGDVGSSKAQSAPVFYGGGSPLGTTPTLPGGWPYKPQEKPETEEKPEKPGQPPEPIDWEEIDDRVEDLYDRFKQIIDMMRTLSWDAFLAWLQTNYGITIPASETDAHSHFSFTLINQLHRWFMETYPNATSDQFNTFIQRLSDLDDRLYDLYDPGPPGSPGTPFGGADDPRYNFDLQNPNTWEGINPFNPDFLRPGAPTPGTYQDADDVSPNIPWWFRIPRFGQTWSTTPGQQANPGTYEA
jgi:hypothetical protein